LSGLFVIAALKSGLSRGSIHTLYSLRLLVCSEPWSMLPVPIFLPLLFMVAYSFAMKMEAAASSETFELSTRLHTVTDTNLQLDSKGF
jgi:hypothetical protein